MKIYNNPPKESWKTLVERPLLNRTRLMSGIKDILKMVMLKGDEALIDLTKRYDGADITNILCTPDEIKESEKTVSVALKDDIRLAISNIKKFHEAQQPKKKFIKTMPGVRCWREARPIEKVGIYVPGGTAPLFSTVLMLAVPAVLAGCKEIVLCSPPQKDGTLHPAILWAAKEAGVTHICKIGDRRDDLRNGKRAGCLYEPRAGKSVRYRREDVGGVYRRRSDRYAGRTV